MTPTTLPRVKAVTLVTLGLGIAAMGLYVADADDAPGAAVMGMLLMVAGVVLGVKAARNRLSRWATRAALAAGLAIAAWAAALTHSVSVMAPLFAQAPEVPAAVESAPSSRHAAAVGRARDLVRAAVLAQNLPGVSVAVAVDGRLVWAEGFGWRDVVTEAPVTPATRFNIGTAAPAVAGAAATLGLGGTGADPAAVWSPEHIGEPEEDFPLFTILRHVIFRPIGLAPAEPLPGDRATFYVPRVERDPRFGRQLMAMRDLACCVDGQSFYSTPSDLVRIALATSAGSVDGTLAGGTVTSLLAEPGHPVVVAVTSNIAHADTPALARRVRETFAASAR